MNNVNIVDICLKFIRFSFLFWFVVFIFFNPNYFVYALIIVFAFFLSVPKIRSVLCEESKVKDFTRYTFFAVFVLLFISKFYELVLNNVFLNPDILQNTIAEAEAKISKGRSLGDLLFSALQIIPVMLFDLFKKDLRIKVAGLVFLLILSGLSRGYLAIILISFFTPYLVRHGINFNFKLLLKSLIFAIAIIILYTILTQIRNQENIEFNLNQTTLALADSFFFPGYNSNLLLNSGIGSRNAILLNLDLWLKFIPSDIYDKNIFSYNMEMTYQIYSYMKDTGITSISVFTYVPEFIIYKPIIIALISPVFFVYLFYKIIYKFCIKYNFDTVSIYIALYSFIVLKSRVPDLISFLILCSLTLIIFDLLNRLKFK